MMSYTHAKIVKVLKSSTGDAELEILHRNDGFFEYRGYVRKIEIDGPYVGEYFWIPSEHSGIFDTAEHAERDARFEVPWLAKPSNSEQ